MRHRLLTYLLLLPLLCLAQAQTKENSIRVSTFLNAAGTDSINDITYYDELRRESTSFTQIELGDVCITSIRSSSPVYHYKLKDHLGSVRMVMGTNGSVSGGSNYYPYGGDFATYNKSLWGYRFCDMRMDRVYGLDLYDSQARFYDPETGRFDTQDRKSENDYAVSPYLYCLANPVNTLDDDGNSAWSKIAKIGFRVGKSVAKQGFSALTKTATYAEAVSDITDDIKTVGNGKASTTDRIMAGVSLASEFLPVSVGDLKDAKKLADQAVKLVHGNSKLSTRAQHAYDVYDKITGKIVKTGVSGGKIRKDGKSYRAEKQVRKWNKKENTDKYESVITKKIPKGKGARDEILKYERKRAFELHQKGELEKDKHIRP